MATGVEKNNQKGRILTFCNEFFSFIRLIVYYFVVYSDRFKEA